jgi:hypothetical protein
MSAWIPNTGQKIERLYAWIATEPGGGEGVCSWLMPEGVHMPLIGADMARIESLAPHAALIARATGDPIRLVEFSTRRVIRETPA